jgi:hypothetical protein
MLLLYGNFCVVYLKFVDKSYGSFEVFNGRNLLRMGLASYFQIFSVSVCKVDLKSNRFYT